MSYNSFISEPGSDILPISFYFHFLFPFNHFTKYFKKCKLMNCLTKNLYEIESLPYIKTYSKNLNHLIKIFELYSFGTH